MISSFTSIAMLALAALALVALIALVVYEWRLVRNQLMVEQRVLSKFMTKHMEITLLSLIISFVAFVMGFLASMEWLPNIYGTWV